MTADKYTRLIQLVTEGAAALELRGDNMAARDAGEIIGALADALQPSESSCLFAGMVAFDPFPAPALSTDDLLEAALA